MSPGAGRLKPARWPLAAGAVLVAALVVADRSGWLLARPDDMATYHGLEALVVRVIDGDTIEIAPPDAFADRPTTRVRLWGVDCPERAAAGRPAEPYAEEAAELTRSVVGDRRVVLALEPHRMRGAFGRVLAHVSIPGGVSLSETLLAAGLARSDDRWPHSHLDRYAELERAARRQGLGIWAEATRDGQ